MTFLELVFLTATTCHLPSAQASTEVRMGPVGPSESYRWIGVTGQEYRSNYQQNYAYSQTVVNLAYETTGSTLKRTPLANNLKPNFAYQLKLEGIPRATGNINHLTNQENT